MQHSPGIKKHKGYKPFGAWPHDRPGSASDAKARCPVFDIRSGHILSFLFPLIQEEQLSVNALLKSVIR